MRQDFGHRCATLFDIGANSFDYRLEFLVCLWSSLYVELGSILSGLRGLFTVMRCVLENVFENFVKKLVVRIGRGSLLYRIKGSEILSL